MIPVFIVGYVVIRHDPPVPVNAVEVFVTILSRFPVIIVKGKIDTAYLLEDTIEIL